MKPRNQGSPALIISFRLKNGQERDVLLEKAKHDGFNVSNFIRSRILNDLVRKTDLDNLKSCRETVKAMGGDIVFMLNFFQKNAGNLDITAEERGRFGTILKRAKEMKDHEP